MASRQTFTERVETFMKMWGYTDSEFGRRALGDPNFILELRRAGRSPTLRTVQKIEEYMKGGAKRHAQTARAKVPLPASPPRKSRVTAE